MLDTRIFLLKRAAVRNEWDELLSKFHPNQTDVPAVVVTVIITVAVVAPAVVAVAYVFGGAILDVSAGSWTVSRHVCSRPCRKCEEARTRGRVGMNATPPSLCSRPTWVSSRLCCAITTPCLPRSWRSVECQPTLTRLHGGCFEQGKGRVCVQREPVRKSAKKNQVKTSMACIYANPRVLST